MTEYYNMNYDGKEVQVESAVRDEEGYSIKGCYAKKTEIKDGTLTINTNGGTTLGTFSANQPTDTPVTITLPNGSVQLLNQSVTFDTYTPTQAEIDAGTYAEFPYKASVSVTGVTSSTYAEVTYSEEQATSLNFATSCDTATDVIYLYSRTNVGTVTIPTISIGMDYSDITIDATPTSGSGNAVSSGGVYTALSTKQDTLTFDSTPTSASTNPVTSGGVYTALSGKANTTALTDGSVTKIGTSTVGSNLKPVYLNAGVPTAVSYDLLPLNIITSQIRISNVNIGSGNNVIMMSAFNNSIEARLVIVAENNQCRLQLEKWTLDGSQMLSQSVLGSI